MLLIAPAGFVIRVQDIIECFTCCISLLPPEAFLHRSRLKVGRENTDTYIERIVQNKNTKEVVKGKGGY